MSVLLELPEVFPASAAPRSTVSDALRRGELRRLARGLYTRNLTDPPEQVVRRNLWDVVAALYPGALVGDRSARLSRPAEDGSLFLVHAKPGETQLPGLVLRPRSGTPPTEGDLPLPAGLHMSSVPRALLENAALSRGRRGRVSRTLNRSELEEWLESLIEQRGEEGFRALREEVRALAPRLALKEELAVLDPLMGAVLGTRQVRATSPRLRARQRGFPYDAERVELFETLFQALDATAPLVRPVLDPDAERYRFLPFFEAYFSNFIEGTEFAVEEAREIVFEGVIPPARPEDAHDVTGYLPARLRSGGDVSVARRCQRTGRPAQGAASSAARRASGEAPRNLQDARRTESGTCSSSRRRSSKGRCAKGFGFYRRLTSPFARAVFQMFLVSEVHPFDDGNGRIARVMMNAELVAAAEQRIIIPQVFRNNYLMGLRALTVNRRAEALAATLEFAQRYTAAIDYSSFEGAREMLEQTNAFRDPAEADAAGVRLVLPRPY